MWLIFAILAAIVWGLEYATSEKVLEQRPALFVLFWTALIHALVFGVASILGKVDLSLQPLTVDGKWKLFVVSCVFSTVAAWCISSSIKASNNASVSSMIEISYPFFVALFSY